MAGAIAFSGKAIIVKLAYRHGVDAVTLIMLRMLFALPLFVALAWWAGRGKPALTARDWRVVVAAGLQRLLPGELSRLLGPAVRQRQPGAADPVPEPDAGAAARRACCSSAAWRRGSCWRWPSAMPACCWSSARSCSSRARDTALGAGAGLRQHDELCAVPGVQRRGGQAPGRAAPHRAGHQRGLRAVHRAVPAAAAAGTARCRWRRRCCGCRC